MAHVSVDKSENYITSMLEELRLSNEGSTTLYCEKFHPLLWITIISPHRIMDGIFHNIMW